jgi:hypothetical protein
MLCYNGGMSVTNIQVQGARTRLIFRIMILGKNPQGPRVLRHRGKVLQGLHIRYASDGLVGSNMEPTFRPKTQV